MTDCTKCPHVIMDYADGYGGGYWFPEGCKKDCDPEDCEEFEEDREDE